MRKIVKTLFLSLFFVALAGLQNANAATCSSYFVSVSCDGITVLSHNIYGDPTGAINPTPTCFAAYDSTSGQFSYYVKFYHITSCDTSQGYNATPSSTPTTVCMSSPSASPINYTYNHCTYATQCTPSETCSDWTSYDTMTERQICTYEESDCSSYSTTTYRCKSGYYATGTSPNTSRTALGCTACPMVCNTQSTSTAGTASVSGCCVAAGTTSSDTTGSFTITSSVCAS